MDMVGGGVLCEGFLDFGLTKVGSDEERGVRRDIKRCVRGRGGDVGVDLGWGVFCMKV